MTNCSYRVTKISLALDTLTASEGRWQARVDELRNARDPAVQACPNFQGR